MSDFNNTKNIPQAENYVVTISKAVQHGIPIQLAQQALSHGIDVNSILDDFLREERPHRWSPQKVRMIKERITRMSTIPIVDNADIIINDKFLHQLVILINESGIEFNKDKAYYEMLKEAFDAEGINE